MNIFIYIHGVYIYIYIYIDFVCQCSMSMYISKIRHLLFKELYFGFFQTFEDSIFEGLEETETR